MKFRFRIVFVALFCALSWTTSLAQYKTAYVDADEVIKSMPEYKKTRVELETFQKQFLKQLDEEKRAIAAYYTEVMAMVKRGELTAQQQRDAEAELQKKQEDFDLKTNEADQQLLAKERALSKPMYDKFEAALQAVAKANKYAYIFDKKMLMYSMGGIEATDKLKKQLGID